MRSSLATLGIGLMALLSGAAPRGEAPEGGKAAPFRPGEVLTYDVTWRVFRAGLVTASLKRSNEDHEDAYEVVATAESQGFVSLLFKVENEFHSLFDPEKLCARRIFKKVHEGRRQKETRVVFDEARRLAILDEKDLARPDAPPKHDQNDIPACVEDVISAFYYMRIQPLEVGKQFVVPINDGSKTHDVVVEVQARERLQTPLGSREAVRVEPRVYGELYKRKGRMLIWFSDDEQRLPLRIKAMISAGSITGTLRSVSKSDEPAPAAKSPARPP